MKEKIESVVKHLKVATFNTVNGGNTEANYRDIAEAIISELEADIASEEMVEKVAIVFGGAFFGEHAAGWEDDHASEMRKEYRIKAQAAIKTILGK